MQRMPLAFGISRRIAVLLTLLFAISTTVSAQLSVSPFFSDHMVLQRHTKVSVWGTADPGATVNITLDNNSSSTTAFADGSWKAQLSEMPAGGPHTLTIEAGDESLTFGDVLVGDVWLCSGQSNMEWVVADANNADEEIASASDARIRHFKVPRSWAERPSTELAGGVWEVASPETVGDFTAVGYYFAKSLRKHVDVPIGLLNSSWGGSRIETWMSTSALDMDEQQVRAALADMESAQQQVIERIKRRAGELPAKDPGLVDGNPLWAAPDLDTRNWHSVTAPGVWEQAGFDGMDGIAWYRKEFTLSEEDAASDVELGLGMIDDSDITWVNGHEVGRMDMAWNQPRMYAVSSKLLTPGVNVIAIRVEDTGQGGGIHGDPDLLYVKTASGTTSLAGDWQFQVGQAVVSAGSNVHHLPTLVYNKMIYPLLPFAIRGALWYQGESNAGDDTDAYAYRELFKTMIASWRKDWGRGDFPFLYVQLANFLASQSDPSECSWAVLRESQTEALALPNTAQAVIIDVGDADDIHPRDKQTVGARLATAARKIAYGQDVVHAGPTYSRHKVAGHRVTVLFENIGSGLVTKGDTSPRGFAIAGKDGRFHWADAAISGGRVTLESENVREPVAVRYAWACNPDTANLYNKEGLPAVPFRTDR